MSEQKQGKILQVLGAVVDVEFEGGYLADLHNALIIDEPHPTVEGERIKLTLEVAQHLGNNLSAASRWARPTALCAACR